MDPNQPAPTQIRVAFLFTALALLAVLFLQVLDPEFTGYDFRPIYAAGYMIRQGNRAGLYDIKAQTQTERMLFHRAQPLLIVHPPFEALMFVPLAMLSYRAAYVVWGMVNICLWMLFAYLARPFAPVPRQPFQYLILCFAFLPSWVGLLDGQTTFLLLLVYWLVFISLRRRQEFHAGALLGLGLFRFQLVLPFALVCLLRRRWKMMAGFGAVAAALGLISVALVGTSGVLSYFRLLLHLIKYPSDPAYMAAPPSDMTNLRGFCSVLLAPRLGEKWTNATVAALSAGLILLAARRWRPPETRESDASLGLAFAAALAVTLVTGFHLHNYDLTLALPALLLVFASPQWAAKSRWRQMINLSILIFYFPPIYFLLSHWDLRYLLFIPLAGFTVAAFGLLEKRGSVPKVFW
jgi:hypothetical protein